MMDTLYVYPDGNITTEPLSFCSDDHFIVTEKTTIQEILDQKNLPAEFIFRALAGDY